MVIGIARLRLWEKHQLPGSTLSSTAGDARSSGTSDYLATSQQHEWPQFGNHQHGQRLLRACHQGVDGGAKLRR